MPALAAPALPVAPSRPHRRPRAADCTVAVLVRATTADPAVVSRTVGPTGEVELPLASVTAAGDGLWRCRFAAWGSVSASAVEALVGRVGQTGLPVAGVEVGAGAR